MQYQQPRLSNFNVRRQQVAVKKLIPEVDAQPWKDITQRFAAHCAQYTSRSLRSCPRHYENPAFTTPPIDLKTFIDHLLRQSGAPLSAAVATLAIIFWITDTGACPIASSSPHHLFMSTYQVFLHAAWERHELDDEWVGFTGGMVPFTEVLAMRLEVEDALETLSKAQWKLLSKLIDEDMNQSITELYKYECIQKQDEGCEVAEFFRIREGLVDDKFAIYESEESSDSDDEVVVLRESIIIQFTTTTVWQKAADNSPIESS